MVFSTMMASLLGGSKPVRAQTIAGSVPEVDRVSIRVVVDSYQFGENVTDNAVKGRFTWLF